MWIGEKNIQIMCNIVYIFISFVLWESFLFANVDHKFTLLSIGRHHSCFTKNYDNNTFFKDGKIWSFHNSLLFDLDIHVLLHDFWKLCFFTGLRKIVMVNNQIPQSSTRHESSNNCGVYYLKYGRCARL